MGHETDRQTDRHRLSDGQTNGRIYCCHAKLRLSIEVTNPLQVIWQEHVAVLIGYNGTTQIHPHNCPFPRRSPLRSITSIFRPIPLTTPNGIRIQSVVLPQYTFQTDRPTDGDDNSIPRALALYYIDRERRANNSTY